MVGFEGWEHILMHIEHRSLYREQGWSWMISNFAHCMMPYIVFLDANPPLGMVILGSKNLHMHGISLCKKFCRLGFSFQCISQFID